MKSTIKFIISTAIAFILLNPQAHATNTHQKITHTKTVVKIDKLQFKTSERIKKIEVIESSIGIETKDNKLTIITKIDNQHHIKLLREKNLAREDESYYHIFIKAKNNPSQNKETSTIAGIYNINQSTSLIQKKWGAIFINKYKQKNQYEIFVTSQEDDSAYIIMTQPATAKDILKSIVIENN